MNYQALAVKNCQSGEEIRATYLAARRGLYMPRLAASVVPEPPCDPDPSPFLKQGRHSASILTLAEAAPPARLSAQEILMAVARAHDVTMADLKGRVRWHRLSHARHHAVALLSQHRSDLSLPMIGSLLNRDHTTIINSRRRWPRLAEKYIRQARVIESLTGLRTFGCG